MPYVIAEPCIGVKDAACLDACPVDAIHPRSGEAPQLYIFADNCICCGACVPVCPVSAIFAEEDLPEQWKHYAKVNSDWYADMVLSDTVGQLELVLNTSSTPSATLQIVEANR